MLWDSHVDASAVLERPTRTCLGLWPDRRGPGLCLTGRDHHAGQKAGGRIARLGRHSHEFAQWKGGSAIRGAPKTLREALYLPALIAMYFDPCLKARRAPLRAIGQPVSVEIVSIRLTRGKLPARWQKPTASRHKVPCAGQRP